MNCFLFPGQGSQARGMGAGLFDAFPDLTETANEILGYSIDELCLRDPDRRLNKTQYTQPAVYVVNALSYLKQVEQSGIRPDYMAGHSLGEYNALQAAGLFSFEDGLRMVQKRGELMAQAGEGAMAAILNMASTEIRQCLHRHGFDGIDIANENGPSQIVVSGPPEQIHRAQSIIEAAGADYIPLNTSGAFHSRYMEPVKVAFTEFLSQFEFAAPHCTVIANLYAEPYRLATIREDLGRQITHPVQWRQSMEYLLDQGVTAFEEIGQGEILSKMLGYIRAAYRPNASADVNANLVDDSSGDRQKAQNQIDAWNERYSVGTSVNLVRNGEKHRTRSKAMSLWGRSAVVYLQDCNGYVELSELSA